MKISSWLLLTLAGVCSGCTVLLFGLGIEMPILLLPALGLGMVSYSLWDYSSNQIIDHIYEGIETEAQQASEETAMDDEDQQSTTVGEDMTWDDWEWRDGSWSDSDWNTDNRGTKTDRTNHSEKQQSMTTVDPDLVDAYRVLGLERGADPPEIRSAYRERVKETHPDTEGGCEEEFKRVQEAYERISDSQ